MLTDEEINDIAKPYISEVGDHWCTEPAIAERNVEDFARAIEKAILDKISTREKGNDHEQAL